MKKIYLLLVLCCMYYVSPATKWFSQGPSGSLVTTLTNWSDAYLGGGANPGTFLTATDTFVMRTNMNLTTGSWIVGGTVIDSFTGKLTNTAIAPATIKIGGALVMTGTTQLTTALGGAGSIDLYLGGDLFMLDHSKIAPALTGLANITIHFNDVSTIGTPKNITWTSDQPSQYANMVFMSSSVRQLLSDVTQVQQSSFNDSLIGTLICGTFMISSANTEGFVIADGASLYTAHTSGLDGSIQSMSSRNFSGQAHYIYNGVAAQITGTTLPVTFSTAGGNAGSVTVNNISGVSLSQVTSFLAGTAVNLETGIMTISGNLTMNNQSNVNVDAGTFATNPIYNALVNVTYTDLGAGSISLVTGNELLPTVPATTIGKLTVNKAGAGATITLGSNVYVNDSVYLMSGSLDASATGNYTIYAKAYWVNNSGINAFVPRGGMVSFAGSAAQVIGGSYSTTFFNFDMNNSGAGANIVDTEYVNGAMSFTAGKLYINSNELIFGSAASPAVGTINNSNHIVANATGHVRKQLTTDGAFLFPIGDVAFYTPITINMTAGGYAAGSDVAVNTKSVKHPLNANVTNYLNRYWTVVVSPGIFGASYTVSADFAPGAFPALGDVTGAIGLMSMGEYNGVMPWHKYDPVAGSTLSTGASTIIDYNADFTGLTTAGPTVAVSPNSHICYPTGSTVLATSSPTGDPGLSYSWAPAFGLSGVTGTSVTATPTVTTTYTVTITDGNGFTGSATTTVSVDPMPTLGGGAINNGIAGHLCLGDVLTLTASLPSDVVGYSWSGPVPITSGATTAVATVTGTTLAASGTYTVVVTGNPGSGCTNQYTTTVTIDALPATTVASGGGTYCGSTSISGANGGDGIVYFQGTVSGGTLIGTGSPVTVTSSGTYYFRAYNPVTGCWGAEGSVTVTINPLPDVHNVTGGGSYCVGDPGIHIGLDNSDAGISYQLYGPLGAAGSPVAGVTGSPIDFGAFTDVGSYTAVATNTVTLCTVDMFGSVREDTNSLPTAWTVVSPGSYCAGDPGADVGLNSSNFFVNYQLYYISTPGATPVAVGSPLLGFGSILSFGPQPAPGQYYVVGTNILTGCINYMADTVTISINPLPDVFNLLGGGTDCAGDPGFDLTLDGSENTGITYQLFSGGVAVTTPISGTGTTVDFGWQTAAGSYIAIAMNPITTCTVNMNNTAVIVVNPLPLQYMVTGGGSYCADTVIPYDVQLTFSDPTINYQLWFNNGGPSTALGSPVTGTSTAIDYGLFTTAGAYTVIGTDIFTGCTDTMANSVFIVSNAMPSVYTVSGGGAYCAGGAGVHVYMDGSTPGDIYQVYVDGVYSSTVIGDGSSPFDMGAQTLGGTYSVVAMTAVGACTENMTGTATVIMNPLPPAHNVTGGGNYCVSYPDPKHITLDGSDAGIDYQLFRSGIGLVTLPGTGSPLDWGPTFDSGVYTVVATYTGTGCFTSMDDSSSISIFPQPNIDTLNGGGDYCAGGPGREVKLLGSQNGVLYDLFVGGSPVSSPIFGSGGPITFGDQTAAGLYTAIGTDIATGCVSNMAGVAFVVIKPLPLVFTVTGAGPYCAGDTGRHVYLSVSQYTVKYQLYYNGAVLGAPVPGIGSGLDFGLFTASGTYSVIATDTITGCSSNMVDSPVLYVNPVPPVYTVTGGGAYCAGGVGRTIGLLGSNDSIQYQLYLGTTPVGSPVTGTGSAISFGSVTGAGTYTVKASDLYTSCASTMTGSAIIIVNPVPATYTITGGGAFCIGGTGVHIGLSGSDDSTFSYQLMQDTTNYGGPQLGTHSALDYGLVTPTGTYKVLATGPGGCMSLMSGTVVVTTNPLPAVHNITVTGSTTYCQGDTGRHLGLDGSNTGVDYQLYAGTATSGAPELGTGSAIDFGLRTAVATYSVVATDTTTHCVNNMAGTVTPSTTPYLVPSVTLTPHPGLVIGVGDYDTVVATVTGVGIGTPIYQWTLNRNIVPGATNSSFVFQIYYDFDTIVCNVTSTGQCGGVTSSDTVILRLKDVAVKQIVATNNDVRLIPNPNKGVFFLKGTTGTADDQEMYVEVTNTLGQVVYKSTFKPVNGTINERIELSSTLANGMYLLNLRSGNMNNVYHFVVEQ